MPNPKKKPSLRERIKKARRKVAIRRKKYEPCDEWTMHDQVANAYLAYGAELTMEALVFLGGVKEALDAEMPLTPEMISNLESLWEHFVKPLRESGAS